MRISLLITVEDRAGYQDGLPALLNLLQQHQIVSTICLSLGFDNSGLLVKRLFRPFVLTRHLPLRQKLQGTLLPPLNLSRRFKQTLDSLKATDHELGIASFDPVNWQLIGLDADKDWTRQQMIWSLEAFEDQFGYAPAVHHASGYIINKHLLSLQSQAGFSVSVDARGRYPFYPLYHAVSSEVLQMPVTLPLIEELLARDGVSEDNVHEHLLAASQTTSSQGHIMHLRAAHEGRQWLPVIEKLLQSWRTDNCQFSSLSQHKAWLESQSFAPQHHHLGWAAYRPGERYLATQGKIMEDENDQTASETIT